MSINTCVWSLQIFSNWRWNLGSWYRASTSGEHYSRGKSDGETLLYASRKNWHRKLGYGIQKGSLLDISHLYEIVSLYISLHRRQSSRVEVRQTNAILTSENGRMHSRNFSLHMLFSSSSTTIINILHNIITTIINILHTLFVATNHKCFDVTLVFQIYTTSYLSNKNCDSLIWQPAWIHLYAAFPTCFQVYLNTISTLLPTCRTFIMYIQNTELYLYFVVSGTHI